MKIAILGVGAMGSVYAALLAGGGHDVIAVDVWKEHVDAINANGLRVEGASGDRIVKLKATTKASDVKDADLVIIATKDDGVDAAAKSAFAIAKPDAPILTIQNGLGSADKVAAIVGSKRIMIGVVGGFGASMRGPGHAHHNGMEFLRLGEMNGGLTPRLEDVKKTWESGGFKVLTFDDIHKMIWEKLICNCTYSGPCAMMGLTVAQMQASPSAWSIAAACASEAFHVARAKGIALDFDDPIAYVWRFGQKIPGARPSMLLDHMAGRAAEVDNINGAIPREGAKLGIATPVNSMIVALLKGKESGFAVKAKG
jgi:2-dehydropantoate 2-reductase